MAAQLGGAAFERVPAIEGRNLSGPERRVGEVPVRAEELTRYELAAALSHKAAWQRLLASGAQHCCVLEDDVVLSPDFAEFAGNASWVPSDASIVKIEALSRRKLFLDRKRANSGAGFTAAAFHAPGSRGLHHRTRGRPHSIGPDHDNLTAHRSYFIRRHPRLIERSRFIKWSQLFVSKSGKLPVRTPFRPTFRARSKARNGSRACPYAKGCCAS